MSTNKYRKETKHFCKFCKVFVQNNLAQITRHEKEAGHLRRMSRLLDSINKAGLGSKSSGTKPKTVISTSINPLLYGLGSDNTEIPTERDPREFKTTEAFDEANPQNVLAARLPSAWEEYIPEGEQEIDLSLNTELKKVGDDDEEDECEEFKVVTKSLPTSAVADDEKPLVFKKKRQSKSTKK